MRQGLKIKCLKKSKDKDTKKNGGNPKIIVKD